MEHFKLNNLQTLLNNTKQTKREKSSDKFYIFLINPSAEKQKPSSYKKQGN